MEKVTSQRTSNFRNKTKQNINPGENVFQGEGSVRSRRDPHGVPEWESSAKELEMGLWEWDRKSTTSDT